MSVVRKDYALMFKAMQKAFIDGELIVDLKDPKAAMRFRFGFYNMKKFMKAQGIVEKALDNVVISLDGGKIKLQRSDMTDNMKSMMKALEGFDMPEVVDPATQSGLDLMKRLEEEQRAEGANVRTERGRNPYYSRED